MLPSEHHPTAHARSVEHAGAFRGRGKFKSERGRLSRERSRLAGVVIAIVSVLGTTCAVVSAPPGTAVASIGSDRSSLRQLEARIANEGILVQSLVSRYDRFEGRLAIIKNEIASEQALLVRDSRSEAVATLRARHLAIDAYINVLSGASESLLSSANATTLSEEQVYAGVASGSLQDALATLAIDRHETLVTESALRSERARIVATLRQIASARETAEVAIERDRAILSHVDSNLLALVMAANEQREAAAEAAAEEREAEAAAAAAAAAPAPTPARAQGSPPPSPVQPTPGGYANPLRAISGLTPERIDQGVDYSGFGSIFAIGDGVVLNTVNAGWPGGTFIAYRLTDGPADGLVVYAAEDIDPAVSVGEAVTSSTVLGQMYEGPDGIETGWADPSALGATMAAEYGQFDGSNSTAFGANFSQLLEALGAPGGVLENPPTGGLPSGWPQW